jgi:hypothetical protein
MIRLGNLLICQNNSLIIKICVNSDVCIYIYIYIYVCVYKIALDIN